MDDPIQVIRAELREDRQRNGLTYRQQAALLGLPFQTLHAFDRGLLSPNPNDGFKAAIARRFPQLKGALAQLSLAWMNRSGESSSSTPAPLPAETANAPPARPRTA